ncbi:MAG: hypothetical protein AWU54_1802 [Candidatus Frackibacter sp. T328-2]|nr:MAG: hypothetical protein AWU54_1802 [Candidatus Frackibacter sp. T328-2]
MLQKIKNLFFNKRKHERIKILRELDFLNSIRMYSKVERLPLDEIKKIKSKLKFIEEELNLDQIKLPRVFIGNNLKKEFESILSYLDENYYDYPKAKANWEEKLSPRQRYTSEAFLLGLKENKIRNSVHEFYDFIDNYKQFERYGIDFKKIEKKVLKGLIYWLKKKI